MPDSKKTVKVMPLPMYYKRKLFYSLKKRKDKTRYWELNSAGVAHFKDTLFINLQNMQNEIETLLLNSDSDKVDTFYRLLDDRTMEDYCVYTLLYHGRSRQLPNFTDSAYFQSPMNDTEYNLHDWLDVVLYASKVNSLSELELFTTFGNYVYFDVKKQCSKDITQWFKQVAFNENSDFAFRNFDKITSLLSSLRKPKNESKQKLFNHLERLKNVYKTLNVI